jgi:hypothetical protein
MVGSMSPHPQQIKSDAYVHGNWSHHGKPVSRKIAPKVGAFVSVFVLSKVSQILESQEGQWVPSFIINLFQRFGIHRTVLPRPIIT